MKKYLIFSLLLLLGNLYGQKYLKVQNPFILIGSLREKDIKFKSEEAVGKWDGNKQAKLRIVGFYSQFEGHPYVVLELKNISDKKIIVPWSLDSTGNRGFFKFKRNKKSIWIVGEPVDRKYFKLKAINLQAGESIFYISPYRFSPTDFAEKSKIGFILSLTDLAKEIIDNPQCLGCNNTVASGTLILSDDNLDCDKAGNSGPKIFQIANLIEYTREKLPGYKNSYIETFGYMDEMNESDALKYIQKEKLIDTLDDEKNTVLHVAIVKGKPSIVNFMLANRKKYINVTNKFGTTPLFFTVATNRKKIALELLKNGANPNLQTKLEFSPLQMACKLGHLEMCKILLEHNAAPNMINTDGETALDIANKEGNKEIIKLLREHGAKTAKELKN